MSSASPGGGGQTRGIADLVDMGRLQHLFDGLSATVGVSLTLIDPHAATLVSSGWQDICTVFHRAHPQTLAGCLDSDLRSVGQVLQGTDTPTHDALRCPNGLRGRRLPCRRRRRPPGHGVRQSVPLRRRRDRPGVVPRARTAVRVRRSGLLGRTGARARALTRQRGTGDRTCRRPRRLSYRPGARRLASRARARSTARERGALPPALRGRVGCGLPHRQRNGPLHRGQRRRGGHVRLLARRASLPDQRRSLC